jgi:NAD+ synthase
MCVACKLEMATVTVWLDKPFGALVEELHAVRGLPLANLKPRLRMAGLYYFANTMSYMVVGTSNKTELMLGYFTKYGDGGVDILPLGGLYETQVRELARQLKLPRRIVERSPSAGLWEGQTDEGELGITYEQLDRALGAIESGRTDGIPPQTMARVKEMVAGSAHKRSRAQVCEV